jgi:hypothetical protein
MKNLKSALLTLFILLTFGLHSFANSGPKMIRIHPSPHNKKTLGEGGAGSAGKSTSEGKGGAGSAGKSTSDSENESKGGAGSAGSESQKTSEDSPSESPPEEDFDLEVESGKRLHSKLYALESCVEGFIDIRSESKMTEHFNTCEGLARKDRECFKKRASYFVEQNYSRSEMIQNLSWCIRIPKK